MAVLPKLLEILSHWNNIKDLQKLFTSGLHLVYWGSSALTLLLNEELLKELMDCPEQRLLCSSS